MECRFCRKNLEDGSIKCFHCGEYLQWYRRLLLTWLPPWIAVVALLVAVGSCRISSSSSNIASREFGLKYSTDITIEPALLSYLSNVPGESEGEVWALILLRAKSKGFIGADNIRLSYEVQGPCRRKFSDKDLGMQIKPFDLAARGSKDDEIPIPIVFTDARQCVDKYLKGESYLDMSIHAEYQGMMSGYKSEMVTKSSWRSNHQNFSSSN